MLSLTVLPNVPHYKNIKETAALTKTEHTPLEIETSTPTDWPAHPLSQGYVHLERRQDVGLECLHM
jgi:hypothetical protein